MADRPGLRDSDSARHCRLRLRASELADRLGPDSAKVASLSFNFKLKFAAAGARRHGVES